MFDSLSERLSAVLDRLTRRGALSEADVEEALREVRRALLEADVALDVARAFTDEVKKRAVGVEVIKSVTPGQMVVKIVHDQLIEILGSDAQPIDLNAPAPVVIMMVGLQGSGKTTTTAKIAKRLTDNARRKVLMASLDTRRPAAMEQLAVLGRQVAVDTLPVVEGQTPVQIAGRAVRSSSHADVVIKCIVSVIRNSENVAVATAFRRPARTRSARSVQPRRESQRVELGDELVQAAAAGLFAQSAQVRVHSVEAQPPGARVGGWRYARLQRQRQRRLGIGQAEQVAQCGGVSAAAHCRVTHENHGYSPPLMRPVALPGQGTD